MRASSIDSRFFGLEGSRGGRVEPRFGCARASLSLSSSPPRVYATLIPSKLRAHAV